jgi:NAD(P)-dependent dehydrogenase (short-subunit alcohol dehydrogenase family)
MISDEVSGRRALVLGGTDGIGKAIARGLAGRRAHVLVVGRDLAKGNRVERELRRASNNPHVEFLPADLALLREAHGLADHIMCRCDSLHYLVHSAGVIHSRRELTEEGLESNFAINYLSRFVLTYRLLPLLRAAGRSNQASRIVLMGGAAQRGEICFDDVSLASNFNVIRVLGQFCRANDVLTVELARRLSAESARVTVSILKIGVVPTNIRKRPGFPWFMKMLTPLVDPFLAMSVEKAADAALRLLLSPDFEGVTGALILMIKKFKRLNPLPGTTDPIVGRKLWELSELLSASTERATASLAVAAQKSFGG